MGYIYESLLWSKAMHTAPYTPDVMAVLNLSAGAQLRNYFQRRGTRKKCAEDHMASFCHLCHPCQQTSTSKIRLRDTARLITYTCQRDYYVILCTASLMYLMYLLPYVHCLAHLNVWPQRHTSQSRFELGQKLRLGASPQSRNKCILGLNYN